MNLDELQRMMKRQTENEQLKKDFENLLPLAKTVEQEVVKLKQYNEDLIYEKEQLTQKIIDLKAELKFATKEYRELNEIAYQSHEKVKKYEKALKELENGFYTFGEITGDRRFVEGVRQMKEKHGI